MAVAEAAVFVHEERLGLVAAFRFFGSAGLRGLRGLTRVLVYGLA